METSRRTFRFQARHRGFGLNAGSTAFFVLVLLLAIISHCRSATVYLTPSSSAEYEPWLGFECDSRCGSRFQPCSFNVSRAANTYINVTSCFIELVGSFEGYTLQLGDTESGVPTSNVTLRAPSGFSGSLNVLFQDEFALENFYAPNASLVFTGASYQINGNVSATNSTIRDMTLTGCNLALLNTTLVSIPADTTESKANIASSSGPGPIHVTLSNIIAEAEDDDYPVPIMWVSEQHVVSLDNVTAGYRKQLLSVPMAPCAFGISNSTMFFSSLLVTSLFPDHVNLTIHTSNLTVKNDNMNNHALMARQDATTFVMKLSLTLTEVNLTATNPSLAAQPILLFSSEAIAETNCTLEVKSSILTNIDFGLVSIVNASIMDTIILNPANPTLYIQRGIDYICISNVTAGTLFSSLDNTTSASAPLNSSIFDIPPVVDVFFSNPLGNILDFSMCPSRSDIALLTIAQSTTISGDVGIYQDVLSASVGTPQVLSLSDGSRLALSSNSQLETMHIDASQGIFQFSPLSGSSGSMPPETFSRITLDSALRNFYIDWPSTEREFLPETGRTYKLADSYATIVDTGLRSYNGWSIRIYSDTTRRSATAQYPLVYRFYRQACAQSCSSPYSSDRCVNSYVCSCAEGWSGPNCDCNTVLLPAGATCASVGGSQYVSNQSLVVSPGNTVAVPSDYTFLVNGDLTINGRLAIGNGGSVVASGSVHANGEIWISTRLREFRRDGRCIVYSTTNLQAMSLQFSASNKVYLELDASDLTTDGTCIAPSPTNAFDTYINTTFTSLTTTIMSSKTFWSVTILTNQNPSNRQDLSRLNFDMFILTSNDTDKSTGLPTTITVNQAKGSTCSKTIAKPGLVSLIVNPCKATHSLPWYAVGIPLIVIVILIIALLIAIMVLKFGQDKILPWHQVIYNPFNPNRRVTLVNID